MLYLKTALRE